MALKCFPPLTALIEAESLNRSTISSSSSSGSSFEKQNLCHTFLNKRKQKRPLNLFRNTRTSNHYPIYQVLVVVDFIKPSMWSFALKLDSSSSTIVVLPPCLSIIERSGGSSARLSTLLRFALQHWHNSAQCTHSWYLNTVYQVTGWLSTLLRFALQHWQTAL